MLGEIAAGALAIRMIATAVVVIGVALAVARFGPAVGGRLAGLPIVLGPGFFFLIRQEDARFVATAASFAILSLVATQLFLLVHVAVSGRAAPLAALLAAVGAWAGAALVLRWFPAAPLAAIALFTLATLGARRLGRGFLRPVRRIARTENTGLLVMRGLLAGLLVAVVTTLAGRLGATAAGLLMAFPVGYTVLSVTIHEQMGAGIAAATLYSAMLGTASLAGFCGTLALLAPLTGGWPAFAAALAVSLAITLGLTALPARRAA